jgi:hydrogenase maturation protein HypF
MKTENIKRKKISVKGIVQGVGFRPAMAKQAALMKLTGKVLNTRDSVEIEIQGRAESVQKYIDEFYGFIPENAIISCFKVNEMEPVEAGDSFVIIESRDSGPTKFSIPPDIAMCSKCRNEFYDKTDRRYLYPFITCGNCGPRYTYMKDMPYDRGKTSMADFPMCSRCLAEYNDPDNRRYHIEGFSCPECGPQVAGFEETMSAILHGKIAAIKGLGGYHIACSAVDPSAVRLLRERKRRPAKPFAVMFRSIEMLKHYVNLGHEEGSLLKSKVSPIVIAERIEGSGIADNVAPGNGYLGVMIPYTPLHLLILDSVNIPLVMTSANVSGDPLIIDDARARKELAGIVDIFLTHNRQIYKRADDSISFVQGGQEISVRMGRGRMPFPVKLPVLSSKKILALGAELKSNISIVSEDNLVTSNHIGDLETPETFTHFRETVSEMCDYYTLSPDLVVCDLHPDYESTAFAIDFTSAKNIALKQVQHHYAHFISCYFENELNGAAAGIIFDGTGYGTDGTVWGGEFLEGDLHTFTRKGRLSHFPLPGGERAIREPWRILSGLLDEDGFCNTCTWINRGILENVMKISSRRDFSPLTSSAGRLFDAAGVLLGFSRNVSYEAEAAIYLEMLAMKSRVNDFIPAIIYNQDGIKIFDSGSLIKELYKMKKSGKEKSILAMRFHNSLIQGAAEIAADLCSRAGIDQVLLSGGVFQNRIMLSGLEKKLASMGLKIFINRRIPSNDAGISAGQAIYGVYNA